MRLFRSETLPVYLSETQHWLMMMILHLTAALVPGSVPEHCVEYLRSQLSNVSQAAHVSIHPSTPRSLGYPEFCCVLSIPAPTHPQTQMRCVTWLTERLQGPFKRTEKLQNSVAGAILKRLAKSTQPFRFMQMAVRFGELGEGIKSECFFSALSPSSF